jgi:hypothetical protein
MRALFIVDSPHETALPALSEIQYVDAQGNTAGGWWVVGQAPTPNTVIICVDSEDATLDALAADENYLYLGDVVEVDNA